MTEDKQFDHARWFILLRWIAIGIAGSLTILAVQVLNILPAEVLLPLSGTIGVLAGLNLLYTRLLHRRNVSIALIVFQVFADVILLTFLVHFSGGVESPLVLLMIFHVIIAGITLTREQCVAIAILATVMIALLSWLELTGTVSHYTLTMIPHIGEHAEIVHAAFDPAYVAAVVGIHGTIFILTAFFVSSVSARLSSKEEELEAAVTQSLRQHQLLERALDTAGTALYVCDVNLQPVLSNSRWEMWFSGLGSAEELRLRLLGEGSPLQQTLGDGKVRSVEIHLGEDSPSDKSNIGQDTRVFQSITAPLVDKEGVISHVVQLVYDISEQKAAQVQLLRAGKFAAVGELAGNLAHEINNPIAIINSKARILLDDYSDQMKDRTKRELEKIVQLSDRVARIAHGLLSYCRPSAASQKPIELGFPIRRALAMIEQQAEKVNIRIDAQLADRLPRVMANEAEVEQIFLNLFLNAISAMEQGGELVIRAKVKPAQIDSSSDMILIEVLDTGPGIPESLRERIFEPFFTTKADGMGTGLGLSVCQGLVHGFGGTISADNSTPNGAVISIKLPVHTEDTGST